MAIPELNNSPFGASLLFSRLPDRLFAPLASANRHRYWALLCRLHDKRFGPDAPIPPSKGFPQKTIVQDIIDAIELQDAWDREDVDLAEGTSIEIRAYAIFNRFHECGWFRIEQPRFDKRVTMQPAVSQFLTQLISFAETGPVFVSGKIRSINMNLQLVIEGTGAGDSLAEAAEQARNLLEHVRNTGTNIRDLMESLNQNTITSQYVQKFFSNYIESVFIGDYRELRTSEHPLSKRAQILATIETIRDDEAHRNRLITWYENKRSPGDSVKAERLFERDLNRLSELQRIDEYLDRLDDEIRRANKRALAFLDYRLRSIRPTDVMVRHAIETILENGIPEMSDPFASNEMMSEDRLAEPRTITERAAPSMLRKVVVSDEQQARHNVAVRARNNRTVTSLGLSEYAMKQLSTKELITSNDLDIKSVSDVRMYQTLSILSLKMSSKSKKMRLDALTMTRGFRVSMSNEPEIANEFISSVPFSLQTRKAINK